MTHFIFLIKIPCLRIIRMFSKCSDMIFKKCWDNESSWIPLQTHTQKPKRVKIHSAEPNSSSQKSSKCQSWVYNSSFLTMKFTTFKQVMKGKQSQWNRKAPVPAANSIPSLSFFPTRMSAGFGMAMFPAKALEMARWQFCPKMYLEGIGWGSQGKLFERQTAPFTFCFFLFILTLPREECDVRSSIQDLSLGGWLLPVWKVEHRAPKTAWATV